MDDDWEWVMKALQVLPPDRWGRWPVEFAVYAGDRPEYRYGPGRVSGPFGHKWLYGYFKREWPNPHNAPGVTKADNGSLVFFKSEEEAKRCFEHFKDGIELT